jgi:hypothetical protein
VRRVSILAAAATMMFVPHAGRTPPKKDPSKGSPLAILKPLEPVVSVETQFWLEPQVVYEALIHEASTQYRIDPALVRAVIRVESAFNPFSVSSAGALGLMQLMPELAAELGIDDPFDPRQNIFGGVRYLRTLLDAHDGNEALALASYNAGPGAVAEFAGVPPYPETERYVRTITGMLARERGITDDKPETPER